MPPVRLALAIIMFMVVGCGSSGSDQPPDARAGADARASADAPASSVADAALADAPVVVGADAKLADAPVVPAPDAPAVPAPDAPVVPAPDAPVVPAADAPVVPPPDAPAPPGPDAKLADARAPDAGQVAPVVALFTATPMQLPAGGGQVVLAWSVTGADQLAIDHGVGAVAGTSVMVNVAATTVYTLTATNSAGSATSTTAVVVGQNPSTSGGRYVAMVSPTDGESFIAPASLRLVAAAHDPNVFTNEPTEGHGGNASKVQFFVDDTLVLEQDGLDAEYWIFKGFTAAVAAGQHRVWARAIYVDPPLVLDAVPVIVTVLGPPSYAQTIDLAADVVLSGATGYALAGSPGGRIRLNGHGFRIRSSGATTGALSLKFVDLFDLGPPGDTQAPGIAVTTSGAVTIEDSIFDGSNPVHASAGGGGAMSIRRNLFRSNMRMPIGQYPDASLPEGKSVAVAELSGSGAGARVFAGNNVGAGFVVFTGNGWVVGGDSDADENVFIGPRVGIYAGADAQIRRNFSHHVYYGGWSQGSNFELGGGDGVVAEHNVIIGSSWPVRGVAGELRYNLILLANHQWVWADNDGGSIHHNVFVGGEGDVGGIFMAYDVSGVRVTNNTIDGQDDIQHAIDFEQGAVTLSSNLVCRVDSPGVLVDDAATVTADYNLFFGPAQGYSDGRTPPHDVVGMDPKLTDPVDGAPFDLDEVGVWQRTTTVRDVLGTYRLRYTPKAGSPAIDTGDPAGGAGNDIGAIGAGAVNPADQFGTL